MTLRVRHLTRYQYAAPVTLCHSQAHLLPRSCLNQRVIHSWLEIRPGVDVRHDRQDDFGNRVTYFALHRPHQELVVIAHADVQVTPHPLPNYTDTPPWETVREQLSQLTDPAGLEARRLRVDSPLALDPSGEAAGYAAPSFSPDQPILVAVADLMGRIHRDFSYTPGATTVTTSIASLLEQRRGVCQDFAHLALACLRSVGLAARYVSGYLETVPPPGQPRLTGSDASHAWVAVWVPGIGWVDFDPTNNCFPGHQHITVAWGRDYSDVVPIKGVVEGGGGHNLEVAVDVIRGEDSSL